MQNFNLIVYLNCSTFFLFFLPHVITNFGKCGYDCPRPIENLSNCVQVKDNGSLSVYHSWVTNSSATVQYFLLNCVYSAIFHGTFDKIWENKCFGKQTFKCLSWFWLGQLFFFLVAYMALCFGFWMKVMLVTHSLVIAGQCSPTSLLPATGLAMHKKLGSWPRLGTGLFCATWHRAEQRNWGDLARELMLFRDCLGIGQWVASNCVVHHFFFFLILCFFFFFPFSLFY